MTRRRLVVRLPNGLKAPGEVILTDVPNADAQFPLIAEIQVQCDMGYWHQESSTILPNYDDKPARSITVRDGTA